MRTTSLKSQGARNRTENSIRTAKHIAILYSSTDLPLVADLRRRIIRLRRDGSTDDVFLAADSLVPGTDVSPETVRKEIAGADLVVVACGTQTHTSMFVRQEVKQSLEQRSRGQTEILPIILKAGVTLPEGLDFAVQAIHRDVLFPSIRWIRTGTSTGATILVALVALLAYWQAFPTDISECPVRFLVFEDPWTGSQFLVEQVGVDREGGYGHLVLRGRYSGVSGEFDDMSFVYSVMPAAPCCGWTAAGRLELPNVVRSDTLRWLSDDDPAMPTLRNEPFSSIEFDDQDFYGLAGKDVLVDGRRFWTNPLNARLCLQGTLNRRLMKIGRAIVSRVTRIAG